MGFQTGPTGWSFKALMERYWPTALRLASDAERLAILGAISIALALAALTVERLLARKGNPGCLGWLPWTVLFIAFAVTGAGLLTASLPVLLRS